MFKGIGREEHGHEGGNVPCGNCDPHSRYSNIYIYMHRIANWQTNRLSILIFIYNYK